MAGGKKDNQERRRRWKVGKLSGFWYNIGHGDVLHRRS